MDHRPEALSADDSVGLGVGAELTTRSWAAISSVTATMGASVYKSALVIRDSLATFLKVQRGAAIQF